MEVQQRILLKSIDLFNRYGFRAITMDEIATQCGISKKTIYQFYPDKNSLVSNCIKNHIQDNETLCQKYSKESKNAIEEIFMTMEMLKEMFETMNPGVIWELERYHPASYKLFEEHKNKFIYDTIKENINKGIKQELYRSDIKIEIMVRMRLETMMLGFNPDVFPKNKFNLLDIEVELLEHFLRGIANSKGNKLIDKYKKQLVQKNSIA